MSGTFEMADEHPVLDEWTKFDAFKREMRRVTTKRDLLWTSFISESIIDEFEMY